MTDLLVLSGASDLSRAKGLIDGVEHMQEIEDFRL